VYQPGTLWDKAPPEPLYSHAPVVRSIDGTKDAIRLAFERLAGKLSLGVEPECLTKLLTVTMPTRLDGMPDVGHGMVPRPGKEGMMQQLPM
jgi:hypothetical protein